ncbi:MAG: hypothetical protein PWP04_1754 [Candidatus Atribacteria bacterium]|nr:hypothetical protein [Candidatus Atribacteria bacterium]
MTEYKEKERTKEAFEEMFFEPINRVFGPFMDKEVREHVTRARVELLRAMRAAIDTEIDRAEKKEGEKESLGGE